MKMMDANEIISFIQKSEKKTPVKVYIKGDLKEVTFPETVQAFVNKKSGVLFGEWSEIKTILDENNKHIVDYV
ncbi:2,3,4,5-tetrahydropyridine-2,6-dicarboxylate N-acetyltransferase, partial [Xenorhabdus sp. 12]|nr:2,3,4,5-tetrahydropyridine-2,6-dicarboxylate N-acetyltransferase [Xenorhabdus sp. 12]